MAAADFETLVHVIHIVSVMTTYYGMLVMQDYS